MGRQQPLTAVQRRAPTATVPHYVNDQKPSMYIIYIIIYLCENLLEHSGLNTSEQYWESGTIRWKCFSVGTMWT